MMKNLLPALGFVLVLSLGITAWLLLGRSGDAPDTADAGPEAPAAVAGDSGPEELAELPGEAEPPSSAEAAGPEVAESSRASIEEVRAANPDWIEGVVQLPADLPDDEELFAYSLGEAPAMNVLGGWLDDGEEDEREEILGRAPVDALGGFRVPFPAGLERGWVAVRGRYAFTSEPIELDLSDGSAFEIPAPVALELGAWIHGLVTVPPGVDPEDASPGRLRIKLRPDETSYIGGSGRDRLLAARARLREDLSFELRAVRPHSAWKMEVVPDRLAAWVSPLLDLGPGASRALTIELVGGGRILGVVRDDAGDPVAGAEVVAELNPLFMGVGGRKVRSARSAEDGSFTLKAVATGRLTLRAEREGYLDASTDAELAEGETLSGQHLELSRGGRISGRVTWEDGKPVEGAEVKVSFDLSQIGGMGGLNAMRGAEGKGQTDAEGRFEVTGLGLGPFTVVAGLRVETTAPQVPQMQVGAVGLVGVDEPTAEERSGESVELSGEEVRRLEALGYAPRRGVARLDHVPPDTEDLELVLREPDSIRGRVIDHDGVPVSSFSVIARLRVEGGGPLAGMIPSETRHERIEDPQGLFRVEGVWEGTWEVLATAEGFGRPEPVRVEVPEPDGAPPVVIALVPAAGISGSVLDPEGQPVEGARVTLHLGLEDISRLTDGRESLPSAGTDAEGAFELEGLTPGSVELVASADGLADSETRSFALEPGQVIRDQVFTLRTGATLTGEVFDAEGEPAVGVMVIAQIPTNPVGGGQQGSRTDSAGFFEFTHLTPGNYQVIAMLGGSGGMADGELDLTGLMESMKFTFVELKEGEETHVLLGAPPANPVRVHGRVTLAGEPAAGVYMQFMRTEGGGMDSMRMGGTDEEGRYEQILAEPGEYYVAIGKLQDVGAQQSVEYNRQIPEDEEEVRLDFELPTGRISGRIIGPGGEPAGGARATITAEGAIRSGTLFGGQYAEVSADEAGRYELDWLRPGTYAVAAGGVLFGGLFGGTGKDTLGRQVRHGVVVEEGSWIRNVDFRLHEPGILSGTVTGAGGQPVAGAAIFVRDEGGIVLERLSMTVTDGSGGFSYSGLAPGRYTVCARTTALTTQAEASVQIRERDTTEVQLTLDEGTLLLVDLTDRSGNRVQASLEVIDEHGRQVNGMYSLADLMAAQGSGLDMALERIGPLPPGTYKVTARTADGRSASKPVSLSPGQGERKLKLRVK